MTEVKNKQVILRNYVTTIPKDSDLYVTSTTATIKFKLPADTTTTSATSNSKELAIIVKNLYLSCDPYQRLFMEKIPGLSHFKSYTPGLVSTSILLSLY